jgi:hypothetical protein
MASAGEMTIIEPSSAACVGADKMRGADDAVQRSACGLVYAVDREAYAVVPPLSAKL